MSFVTRACSMFAFVETLLNITLTPPLISLGRLNEIAISGCSNDVGV